MLQLSEKAKRLYDLLFTKEFSLILLKNELKSGAYTPEDVSAAGFQYIDDCSCDIMDENQRTPCRPQGTVLPGYCSSHMLEALKLLDFMTF